MGRLRSNLLYGFLPIQIFHVAHRNCRIIRITNDFIFNFFKTFNAFFNQYLMNRRQGKRIMNKPQKFLFIVCKPSPGSAQSKSRTQNYRITDGLCRLKGFFCCIGDKGRRTGSPNFSHNSLNSSLSSACRMLSLPVPSSSV